MPDLDQFLAEFRAAIIVLSGRATGMEYVLDQRQVRLGRGPGVDLAIDDPSIEREHAVLEFAQGGFHVRSIADREDTRLNGSPIDRERLKPEDRLCLGEVAFEFVLEPRRPELVPVLR